MQSQEIMRSQKITIVTTIIACLALGLSVFVYVQYHSLLQSLQICPTRVAIPMKDAEKSQYCLPVVQSWSALQSKVKNTVVQVFNQGAAIDLLQPYKSPTQFQSLGSAFFINAQGELVTNAHVVDQSKGLYIQIPSIGKRQIEVQIVGVSPDRDLALLKVSDNGLKIIQEEIGAIPFLELGDSDTVHRADEIMTLGYPLGQQGLKSTTGVVSGREQHMIQISAPINPGNSGGPSLNIQGEVIGINTSGVLESQNVGYIIPINELRIVLDELRTIKLLKKPFLGVICNTASDALTGYLGNPQPGGLYVVDVYKDSPLLKAGVLPGDMIYEINGHKIDLYGELAWGEDKISLGDYAAQLKLGQKVTLLVYRKGVRKTFSFIFEQSERLDIHRIYPGYEKIDYEIFAGMVVQPLALNHLPLLVASAPGLTRYAEMKHQSKPVLVITHIFPDSQAMKSHTLSVGALLSKVNGVEVKTLDELRTALFKGFDSDFLTVETVDSLLVVTPFRKTMLEERRLAQDYLYALSPVIQKILARIDQEREHKAKKSTSDFVISGSA